MSENDHDSQLEDAEYDHGEEILLGGASKLVVVCHSSLTSTKVGHEVLNQIMSGLVLTSEGSLVAWRIVTCCVVPNRKRRSHSWQCITVFRQQKVRPSFSIRRS